MCINGRNLSVRSAAWTSPKGSVRGRDRKSRQDDAGDFRNGRFAGAEGAPNRPRRGRRRGRRPRAARTAGGGCRARAPRSGPRASRRPHQQAAMRGLDVNAVVADEARERERSAFAGADQREREARLARSRRPRGSAPRARRRGPRRRGWSGNRHARAGRSLRSTALHHIAGRRTTKRAPSTFGPSGPVATPMRFSARMRPPCASTIWREIERPRPEFWPKPWCGRSV